VLPSNPPGTRSYFAYARAAATNIAAQIPIPNPLTYQRRDDMRKSDFKCPINYLTCDRIAKVIAETDSQKAVCEYGKNFTLLPLDIPREAWLRGSRYQPPIWTSTCSNCDTLFAHNQIMVQRLHQYSIRLIERIHEGKEVSIVLNESNFSDLELDYFRCLPPDPESMFKAEHVIKFGLCLCDFQYHYACHTASCFRKTTRTPMGKICRYLVPWLAVALKSCFDKKKNKFISSRPIGTEYYNTTNLVWAQVSKSNSDCQILINSPGEDGLKPTVYVTKYAFKRQNDESNLIMKIGLILKGIRKALSEPDTTNLSPGELGRRVLNKILYYFSAPIDLPFPLAALCIINDGLFFHSHEQVYINLHVCTACFSNVFGEIESDDENDDNDRYLNFNIHASKLKENEAVASLVSDEDAGEHELVYAAAIEEQEVGAAADNEHYFGPAKPQNASEEDIDLCIMQEYWSRDAHNVNIANLNYITYLEDYGLSEGENAHVIRNTEYVSKCIIVTGRQMPNRGKFTGMSEENFYYKSMLVLFKPSFGKRDLKTAPGMPKLR